MTMHVKTRRRDFWAGVSIAGIGAAAINEAMNYQIGELARMGPGFFPLSIGVIMIVLGFLIPFSPDPEDVAEDIEAAKVDASSGPTPRARLRGMACIAAGIAAFIVLGRYVGFIPASFALVFIAALGDTSNTLKGALILATGITLFGALVFSYALQLQFPMFRWG